MSRGRDAQPLRVLVVDDDAVARTTMRRWCTMLGEVEIVGEAADGTEAVDLAQRVAADVIIMDEAMPRMSGVEATRKLRALGIGTPVLFFTADDTVPDRIEGISGVSYLRKASAGPAATLAAIRQAASA